MNFSEYLLLFGGMGLVTYGPRALPLLYLAHQKMPPGLVDWLGLIPGSILAALLAPLLFCDPQERSLQLDRPELLVALPTLLFALKTRSLGGTVFVGMGLYWLAGFVL
ncbi:MAG: AzlD domain-containing protein [Deltaproteobacteria bacterium]|nr:AzlD domain-containing protein [Deltaproteobacteria bacterium]NCP02140.1 AzlD domain-containing protein [Deltaproteobacteria bacterium]